jgi:hypothetical protein
MQNKGDHQKVGEFSQPAAQLCHALLEKAVDTLFIKEIPGHFKIKTTQRYLHIARTRLTGIESGIDSRAESPGA